MTSPAEGAASEREAAVGFECRWDTGEPRGPIGMVGRVSIAETRCNICQSVAPASPHGEEGASLSLSWSSAGVHAAFWASRAVDSVGNR